MSFTIRSCDVQNSPQEVAAGAEFILTARVVCDPPFDLRGSPLWILDHDGNRMVEVLFKDFDGTVNIASRATVCAPDLPGSYTWSAMVVSDEEDEDDALRPFTGQSTPFSFVVAPHATRLMVWDVPSAIETGARFSIKIGLKCSSGCDMEGRRVAIMDHFDAEVGAARISGALWPECDGLYFVEVDLTAPDTSGQYQWQIQATSHETAYSHQAAVICFGVHTVTRANCTVRIEAVDSVKDEPLRNMSVVMHPYRARTDDAGVAEIRVARGSYSVFLSGRGYYPMRREMDVNKDVTTRAALEAEPPQSKDW
uniref:hypothetical protein n=1 Tax=Pararhizobium sp. IMCC3301 TaxID=3067904 RepID=UPI0027404BDC|nr:hypothetical protein [Pararhizobium sp. IMCC3301]